MENNDRNYFTIPSGTCWCDVYVAQRDGGLRHLGSLLLTMWHLIRVHCFLPSATFRFAVQTRRYCLTTIHRAGWALTVYTDNSKVLIDTASIRVFASVFFHYVRPRNTPLLDCGNPANKCVSGGGRRQKTGERTDNIVLQSSVLIDFVVSIFTTASTYCCASAQC